MNKMPVKVFCILSNAELSKALWVDCYWKEDSLGDLVWRLTYAHIDNDKLEYMHVCIYEVCIYAVSYASLKLRNWLLIEMLCLMRLLCYLTTMSNDVDREERSSS